VDLVSTETLRRRSRSELGDEGVTLPTGLGVEERESSLKERSERKAWDHICLSQIDKNEEGKGRVKVRKKRRGKRRGGGGAGLE